MTAALARREGNVPAAPPPIRLLIVDDSPVARAVLVRMLGTFAEFEIAGTAGDAAEALASIATLRPDVVLLDLEMPGGNGLDILPEIVRAGSGARVLIVSSFCSEAVEAAVLALGEGLAETLAKPGSEAFTRRFSDVLAERLLRLGRRSDPSDPSGPPACSAPPESVPPACIALGASTGGLAAVTALLAALPARIGAPILVTQHLPPVFVPFFARQIAACSARPVAVAEDGHALVPDEILLAPGDAHLSLARVAGRVEVRLDRAPDAIGCLPAVDVMLRAVAGIYGPEGLAVVLSGMGRDGLAGSRALAAAGGSVLAQDRESSAVWGMPRAVAEAGLASGLLPPAALAGEIARRAEARPCR